MSDSIPEAVPRELSLSQRYVVLAAAFLGWLFAGLQIALFVLIHVPAMVSLMASESAQAVGAASAVVDEAAIKQWFAWFQAAFLFGAAAGGWMFGLLGDRLGRTRSLAFSVLCYSLFTGACYFASSPTELLVLRFLACFGIGGAWPNTVALVAEAWPNVSRPFLAGLLGTAANIGQVLVGVTGVCFDVTPTSWRWVLLVGAAPAVLGVWCLIGVPESVRWLTTRMTIVPNSASPLQELFRPPLRRMTLLGIALGAVPVIGTAANAQWIVPWTEQVRSAQARAVPSRSAEGSPATSQSVQPKPKKADPKAKAWTQIFRSGGAVFGSLLGGVLAMLLGRRSTYFLISLLSLVASTIVFGWLTPLHPWFNIASFLFGFVGTIYFGWLPLFLPELFPTRVRATGTGISFNTGRVVAGIVTLATGVFLHLAQPDYAAIGFWTGMIYAVGMIIILFAPRDHGGGLKE